MKKVMFFDSVREYYSFSPNDGNGLAELPIIVSADGKDEAEFFGKESKYEKPVYLSMTLTTKCRKKETALRRFFKAFPDDERNLNPTEFFEAMNGVVDNDSYVIVVNETQNYRGDTFFSVFLDIFKNPFE